MSKGILFDPINYTKRPPYAEGKPQGPLFGTILGCPDNKYLREKASTTITLGTYLGLNYGLFGTVLKDQPGLTHAKDIFLYYTARCGENAFKGATMGAGYFLASTASCKLRGDKDDGVNHFFGGLGLMAYKLTQGNWRTWLFNGVLIGCLAASFKGFYMSDVQFVKYASGRHCLTNCRYPEMYLYQARAPPENLK